MSKKYRMGKRFQKVLTMGILAEIAVLVVAYFVYDWLLGEWIPSLTGGLCWPSSVPSASWLSGAPISFSGVLTRTTGMR